MNYLSFNLHPSYNMKSMIAQVFNSGNSRNGYYERELNTSYGTLNLTIPGD
ncbi:MAG TPA: hypothetical protein GXZ35_01005 [Acholeplasmataceae bacterium]|nr:hypothetical protein [Acholeplasmataceae bacterium]